VAPIALWLWSLAVALVFWGAAALRHALLQSNAYDLGLFDQWAWLLAAGRPPISSMEGVHVLADHAAWLFPLVALPYRLLATPQWLLASQALALGLTAIPLWAVARQAGLTPRLAWLVCGLWWLQPVVFNANLFDFHPEVWAMPALAGSFWALRAGRRWLWLGLLLVLLGCRDGLALVVLGLGLGAALERRWRAALLAWGLGLGWLVLLSRWLYPLLRGEGPKAAAAAYGHLGGSVEAIVLNLLTRPQMVLQQVPLLDALVYLLLLAVAVAPFWRRASLATLATGLPLVLANLLSSTSSQRTLIHHYNLPVAVIVVVAAVDGLAVARPQGLPWRRLAWAALCWAALAKPWFCCDRPVRRSPRSLPGRRCSPPATWCPSSAAVVGSPSPGRSWPRPTWPASMCCCCIRMTRAGPPIAPPRSGCWRRPDRRAGAAGPGVTRAWNCVDGPIRGPDQPGRPRQLVQAIGPDSWPLKERCPRHC
jgi:uncharacterized membrane protein